VKLPIIQNYYDPREALETYIQAYELGLGINGAEQVAAYKDSDKPAVVCEYVDAPELRWVDEAIVHATPAAHYLGLLATFEAMQGNLKTDEGSHNVLYSPADGFTVIDYRYGPEQTLAQKVLHFASCDVLLEYAEEGDPVPAFARQFQSVVGRTFGVEMYHAVASQWLRQGFTNVGTRLP